MTTCISGTGLVFRHPAQLPLSVFIVLVVAYTAIAPNFDQPFINYAFASAIIFLFVTRPEMAHCTAAVTAGVGLSLCHAFFPQVANIAVPSVNLYAGMLGRGSLVVLGWRTIWATPQQSRRRLLESLLVAVAIVLFVLASLVALHLTALARSRVLDFYLYLFDGSLGFQPSFLLGRLFSRYKLVAGLIRDAYFGLPLVIALASVGYLKCGSPWRPLAILASAGLLGYLLYFVFPAAGPIYAVGSRFPNSPLTFAMLEQLHSHSSVLPPRVPRNAMPSLHMAWALLVWFNCRRFSRVWRRLAATYVVLTVVGTLGAGEHYLADLVVALPFSVAVQALWTQAPAAARYAVMAGGAILTFMWLAVLRYGADFFALSPAIPWGCMSVSTIISLALLHQLRSREGAFVDHPAL